MATAPAATELLYPIFRYILAVEPHAMVVVLHFGAGWHSRALHPVDHMHSGPGLLSDRGKPRLLHVIRHRFRRGHLHSVPQAESRSRRLRATAGSRASGWNASVELAHAAIVMPIRHGANNKDRPRNGLGKSGLARASVRLEHAARTLHVRHWNGKPKIVQPIEHVDSMFLDHARTCRPPCRSSST